MTYNPEIHHRRSVRLKNYDYSKAGAYSVTIVVQERACLFGKMDGQKLILNDAGKMIERWARELSNKFRNISIDQYVVMPNHIHTIIQNTENISSVGTDLRVRPILDDNIKSQNNIAKHIGSPLHRVVQWFKTMTTNAYIHGVNNQNWPGFSNRLWQRNYYEHVIRNENELNEIRNYIIDNPLKWEIDQENPNVAT